VSVAANEGLFFGTEIMAGRKNEIAVGILFIVAVLILGYFTIIMKDELFDNREYYSMRLPFLQLPVCKKV
jgi:hypothetical protein